MKLKLVHKVFLANFSVIGLLSIVLLSVSYYSFKKMSSYIDDSAYLEDQYMVNDLAADLGDYYTKTNSWRALELDRDYWRLFIDDVMVFNDFPPPRAEHFRPRPQSQFNPPPPLMFNEDVPQPHFRRPHLVSRIELIDRYKKIVIKVKHGDNIEDYFAIKSNGTIVGWLGLVKTHPAQRHGDALLKHQLERVFFMAFIGLVLSCMVSFYLARHFIAPIRNLIQGAIGLSERKFDTKIEINSNDELAELAHYFNDIGVGLSKFEVQQKQWLQDIAHELRTPLTVIRGEIEAMVDGITPPTELNLRLLQQDVLRLNHLLNDLHQLSVTDNLALNSDSTMIRFDHVCLDSASRFHTKLSSRNISLMTDVTSCAARGDHSRLLQVIDNILHNCHKYTEEGGSVWVSCAQVNQQLVMTIEDSGPGVESTKLDKLFDRLYRVDSHRGRQNGGAGLGLAICKNIIIAHHGDIVASASEHGGLKITIHIPKDLSE
ncbi:MAG: HAMP domain-containing protein [Gammaproteobacteria bacterium]|nr:HAMP domain-containing protein [Gammaproteobacteria bacterium]